MDPRRAGEETNREKSQRQRVLVVEDELIIGEIAAEALMDAGYEAFTAASAEEAEIILRDMSVDVLFTDINLGGRDGFELARGRTVAPTTLVGSLYLGPLADLPRHVRVSGIALPAKPYRLTELVEAVERALKATTTQ